MVDPHVHFHVMPRYAHSRSASRTWTFPTPAGPARPTSLGRNALARDAAQALRDAIRASLAEGLRRARVSHRRPLCSAPGGQAAGHAMTIGLLVLLAERMVRLLDTTLGKKNSFGVVFEMLAYLVPHYLGLAFPAALFLGLLFGFNKMSKDSEIDAFLASGVGLHRLAQPVAILSLILAACSLPDRRLAAAACPLCLSLRCLRRPECRCVLSGRGRRVHAGGHPHLHPRQARPRGRIASSTSSCSTIAAPSGTETVTAAARQADRRARHAALPVLRLETGHRLQIERMAELRRRSARRPVDGR